MMFEKLVESNEKRRYAPLRKRLLAICSATVISFAGTGLLTSMFSEALAMNSEGWETERLFYPKLNSDPERAPEPLNESTPATNSSQKSIAVRREHIARMGETINKVPDAISTVPNALRERPLGRYTQGDKDIDPPNPGFTRDTDGKGMGFGGSSEQKTDSQTSAEEPTNVAPPPKMKKPEEKPGFIGIVNGKALDLVIPVYPQSARQLGIKGHVKIQVLIDESGNVQAASFVEGPGMLRSAALAAARASRFTPTILNGKNVPVRGLIVYNFK